MYSISDEARSLLSKNYRQIVRITCNGLENEFELTESDIVQGGLSINRYCVSGDKIEIGSAVASELTLKLDNRDDRFSETVFEGAELYVQLGIKKWDAYRWENAQIHWIPLGYFTVDETPRKLSHITLSALDRTVRFDKEVTENDITFPIKISSLLSLCCANCNVPLRTIPTSLLNADYVVTKFPEYAELTYRRLIQWIAEISGTCAFVDWNGELRLSGYSLDTDFSLTPSDRYSSDMYEQDITVTGVQISDDDGNVYLAGTDYYAFNIENNGLIQSNHLEIATAIFDTVKDIAYRPYTCTCKPLPYVYPLDSVSYTDKKGVIHKSIVTNITFKMNASTTLEGKGETQTKNGYASANPLTKAESVVLKKLENRVNRKISNYEQASLDMNEIISNSLGLYRTEVVEENGSTTYYYHDATTLENSAIIYTFNAGGFAWTTEWEGAETVWNYGITKDGNAVYNILSAFKIQSELLETGCITTDKIKVGAIGGFEIDETHIGYGKSAYNDKNDGVYLSPNGIGLGAGKFYATADGKLVANNAEISGKIEATEGSLSDLTIKGALSFDNNYYIAPLGEGTGFYINLPNFTVGENGANLCGWTACNKVNVLSNGTQVVDKCLVAPSVTKSDNNVTCYAVFAPDKLYAPNYNTGAEWYNIVAAGNAFDGVTGLTGAVQYVSGVGILSSSDTVTAEKMEIKYMLFKNGIFTGIARAGEYDTEKYPLVKI